MRPKFEVGEVVILHSKEVPHKNGEYVVTNCRYGTWYTGVERIVEDGWSYWLGDEDKPWAESALRKKHTPGELSFTDLMASLSSPKLITHTP